MDLSLADWGLPGNVRVPFFYAGLDNSLAGFYQNQTRVLVFGQMLSTGTATQDVAQQIFNNEDALFGRNSMLSQEIRQVRKNAPAAEIWAIPQVDSGVASEYEVTVTNAPVLTAETVYLMVGGRFYSAVVRTTDTNTTVAQALADDITDDDDSVVSATASSGVITLVANHQGEDAGKIDIRTEYRRRRINAGAVTLTAAQTVTGSSNPDVANSIANMVEEPFDWVCFPYLDANNLSAIVEEYNDTSGRWNAIQKLYGHVFSGMNDTLANRIALGNTLNSQHLSIFGTYNSPTPSWEIGAAITGKAQLHLSDAPELSRPLQTVVLEGVLPPEVEDVDDFAFKQSSSFNGMGFGGVTRSGEVFIERLLTTYQTNKWGSPDSSYLDVQTLAQAQYFIKYIQSRMTQTFPRHALKKDGDILPPGAVVTNPRTLKGYVAAWYQELENRLVIEDAETAIQLLQVEVNDTDPNCVDFIMHPDFVNQFRIAKVLVQFFNQYPETIVGA